MKRPSGFDGDQTRSEVVAEQKTKKRAMERRSKPAARENTSTASPVSTDLSDPPKVSLSSDSSANVERLEIGASGEKDKDGAATVVPLDRNPTKGLARDAEPETALRGVKEARAELKRAERSRRARERGEQRRFTSHIRSRRRKWFIGIAAVVGLALFVAVGVLTPITAVREVRIVGAQSVDSEALLGALARFEGVPLALVDDAEVHRALEPFPLIQRYAVERIPPHTLVVRLEERVAVIALQRDEGFDLFDPSGVLLFRVPERPAGVPLGSAELQDVASDAFRAASAVIRDLPADLREQLAEVRANNGQNVTFTMASGTELVWGDAKNTQRKAAVLRSMLAAVGSPSMIDVSAPEAPVFS